jgi:hypothetical protein
MLFRKVLLMGYEIDFPSAEKIGCSLRLMIADRAIFFVKNFKSGLAKYFDGDKNGIINKEISRSEVELWLKILADNEEEISEIKGKLGLGKKY